jgi:hypothetical protein
LAFKLVGNKGKGIEIDMANELLEKATKMHRLLATTIEM